MSIIHNELPEARVLDLCSGSGALGLEEGAKVSVAHRGVFGGADPVAVTVGPVMSTTL